MSDLAMQKRELALPGASPPSLILASVGFLRTARIWPQEIGSACGRERNEHGWRWWSCSQAFDRWAKGYWS
jgi:hypothetical protein